MKKLIYLFLIGLIALIIGCQGQVDKTTNTEESGAQPASTSATDTGDVALDQGLSDLNQANSDVDGTQDLDKDLDLSDL